MPMQRMTTSQLPLVRDPVVPSATLILISGLVYTFRIMAQCPNLSQGFLDRSMRRSDAEVAKFFLLCFSHIFAKTSQTLRQS